MRVQIVSDAWYPQVNGVVRTVEYIVNESKKLGYEVDLISSAGLKTYPIPIYPEIRLAPFAKKFVSQKIKDFNPDCLHIATEGPLGLAARNYCLKNNIEFTTCYHTNYADMLKVMLRLPFSITYWGLRWFHRPAKYVLATTSRMAKDLEDNGFENVAVWGRGVDTDYFTPDGEKLTTLKQPIFCYVGRVSVEKNITAFLDLDLPGTKLIIGDGPQLKQYKAQYPDAHFTGSIEGEELVKHYRSSDVFVFASKNDTFGLVMLEALACGVPVAAFPVRGPLDVLEGCEASVMDEDLQKACLEALHLSKTKAREFAEANNWHECVKEFHTFF